MKVDTHTHTSGVSFCSEVNPQQYVDAYVRAGFKTVILTNHYSRIYMFRYGATGDTQVKIFLDEYAKTARLGKEKDLNVILGAEVAISTRNNAYAEFLLYGADEAFFLQHTGLYDYTQKKLYKLCCDNNVFMVQAHPYRIEQGHTPQDPEFMDGVEINARADFLRSEEKVREFAAKHGLGIVCGSDFHYLQQAGSAATQMDSTVKTAQDVADFLRKNKNPDIFYR